MGKQMQEQEVFNKVCDHLMTQKKAAVRISKNELGERTKTCLYRTASGLKCAIGCLLPDTVNTLEFEGANVASLADEVLDAAGLTNICIGFLERLQDIHDNFKPSLWARELRKFAKSEKLVEPKSISISNR